MCNAFKYVFNEGNDKVVIIGTDCPGLNKHILETAFIELNEADVVIGPAKDGGYYLLGLKKCYSALFSGIAWITSDFMETTIKKCNQLNLNYKLLEILPDIDVEEDLIYIKDLLL